MIYGFNDNKEKVEMYSKDDFIVLTSDEFTLATQETKTIDLKRNASLKDYVVLSLMLIKDHSADNYMTYYLPDTAGDFKINYAFIKTNYDSGTPNDFLRVNFSVNADNSYKYRLRAVLLKVS
jgi:hypothetical protein